MVSGVDIVCSRKCWTGLGSNGEVSEMNTDGHETYNTAETITWTLRNENGETITFKVPSKGDKVWVSSGGTDAWHSKESARHIWYNFIGMGYSVVNKCVHHDMKKFHDAKRKKERSKKAMESISASMDDFVKSYKKQYAKKAYTDNWDKYALEA